MIRLETYKGTKSRHTCPACNTKGAFVRYVGDGGEYISETVGRCNRESKCGYHYKPKQFFADNPTSNVFCRTHSARTKKRDIPNYGFANKNGSQVKDKAIAINRLDFIPFEQFQLTLSHYERNAFVQFLLDLFPDCSEEIQAVLRMYLVGTYQDYTCFPSIDRLNRICRAKLIKFNRANGKRLKGDYDTSSLPAKLKLKEGFNYKQIFFGEHLLPKYPNNPVAVVEAEKTAIIASLCFPTYIWLGSNSKTWLNAERLKRLGQRQITLYPDADGFELWQTIASDAQRVGMSVKVSLLIESFATDEQKQKQYDLADYLIEQQTEINLTNQFIDEYNANLETILTDEFIEINSKTIIDKQSVKAITNSALNKTATAIAKRVGKDSIHLVSKTLCRLIEENEVLRGLG